MPPDLLSTARSAARLNCSLKTVHRLVADGTLKPYLLGPGGPHGAFMFKRSDIERIAKARKQPAA